MTTQSALRPNIADYAHLEPLPDPPQRSDMQQSEHITTFKDIIRIYFTGRHDVLVSGDGYLRSEATRDTELLVPDCVVTFGVNPEGIIARNGYVISEVGKPPDFVLEVASKSTGRNDYTYKRDQYAAFGVREYWRFDHTGGEYHDAPIAGDTLVDGRYERLPIHEEADGMLWGHSEILGLDLCWDGGELRFRNLDGEFLPGVEDVIEERDAERQRADDAEQRAADERLRANSAERRATVERTARLAQQQRADAERTARLEEQQRADDAETENARLREQLRRFQQNL